LRASLVASGLETIRARHSCAHRVDELLEIVARLAPGRSNSRPGTPHSAPPNPEGASEANTNLPLNLGTAA